MTELYLRNRQHSRKVDLKLFRQIAHHLLTHSLPSPSHELGVYLVEPEEIARLNETFLHHTGSTDVITFHYPDPCVLRGEIFISVADAISQARSFQTSWQSELARYLVHGLLHLHGFDDLTPPKRRIMKRHENRILSELAALFPLPKLGKPCSRPRPSP